MNPWRARLEEVWAAGHTPRVVSVLPMPGLPEHVAARMLQGVISLDLAASYPLNIVFTDAGFDADFAFQGHVARCTVTWASLRAIVTLETGDVMKLRGDETAHVVAQVAQPASSTSSAAKKAPFLRVLTGGKK